MLNKNELSHSLGIILLSGISADGDINENEIGNAASYFTAIAGGTDDDYQDGFDYLAEILNDLSEKEDAELKKTIEKAVGISGKHLEKSDLKDVISWVQDCQENANDKSNKEFVKFLKDSWGVS